MSLPIYNQNLGIIGILAQSAADALATPQNVTANGTTVSWDKVENATSYAVLADGSEIGTVEAGPTGGTLTI